MSDILNTSVLDSQNYDDPNSVLYRGVTENNAGDNDNSVEKDTNAFTYDTQVLTNEEKRIWNTKKDGWKQTNNLLNRFKSILKNAKQEDRLLQEVINISTQLFKEGTQRILGSWEKKDQILYETRILFLCYTKFSKNKIVIANRFALLQDIESYSRGRNTVKFTSGNKKVLVSGFDPFVISGNLPTNKSGFLALALHNQILGEGSSKVEIQSVTWPVRYEDFDKGFIESFYNEWIDEVDGIITFSLDPNTNTNICIDRFAANYRGGYIDNNIVSFKEGKNILPSGAEFYETTLYYSNYFNNAKANSKNKFQVFPYIRN